MLQWIAGPGRAVRQTHIADPAPPPVGPAPTPLLAPPPVGPENAPPLPAGGGGAGRCGLIMAVPREPPVGPAEAPPTPVPPVTFGRCAMEPVGDSNELSGDSTV